MMFLFRVTLNKDLVSMSLALINYKQLDIFTRRIQVMPRPKTFKAKIRR